MKAQKNEIRHGTKVSSHHSNNWQFASSLWYQMDPAGVLAIYIMSADEL